VRTSGSTLCGGLTTSSPTVVDLQDINNILKVERDVDEQHNPPLLFIEKWSNLKRQAISAVRYREVPFVFEMKGLEQATEYLKKGLGSASKVKEETLTRNSRKLKASEAPLLTTVGLARAGFGR
jgi:hypothetical protein